MRCAVYARVSSDPKALGRSVAEQEAECRAVADNAGWQVVHVFVDNDRSASRYAKKVRPEYKRLIDFVRAGKCEVVVTWEASRFQRDLEDYVKLRELCRKAGVLWSYSGRTYDLSRTDDRLMTGLDALLAERESDVTRDRILRTVRANAAKGRPHGRMPYGYTREYDPKSGVLLRQVIREDQAAIIREAAKRLLAGESGRSIARDFNSRDVAVSHNGSWDSTRVHRLVTNPAYNAKRIHQGKIVGEADWEPILDEATFLQCAAKLSDPARKTTDEHKVKYLLSGIATCGVCRHKLKVMPQRGGYRTYQCTKGFCVARKLDRVDDLIEKLVIGRLSQPDALNLLIAEHEADDVLEELAGKRARLTSFYDAAAAGDITAGALGRIEAPLLAEIEILESKIRRFDVPTVLFDLVKAPAPVWKALLLEQKREVIQCLMTIRILPAAKGRRTFQPELIEVRWQGSDEDEPAATA